MLTLHSRTITVSRLKLLESLRANSKKHTSEYDNAIKDYHTSLSLELKKALKIIAAITDNNIESVRKVKIDFDAPISHSEDYRKAIQMLEFSNSDNIEVDESAFEAYVNNNWPWQKMFFENAVKYATLSGRI